ncbi:hypothetical protein BDP27DRAFT_1333403 [Rhodocollybia butyracea]|uniref:Aminoglycoside phosphotransferase domain-containing protein n=1 Tax=Rhodocollybia butyracea TaxID=206335 RepID=A0A9P5PJM1_9AGAR|nr:hypothetical protein BDP27DRAFT_1333403 [Rhodocollybia butyracea]
MSLENPFVAFEQAIIAACAKHEEDNHRQPGYRRLIHFNDYIVKFGDSWCFSSEVRMHNHFSKVTANELATPRVPLIHYSFENEHLRYAIIEPIQTIQVAEDIFIQKVADAVSWMRDQACPVGVALGPLGSGPIYHEIFKTKYAPLPFTSVVALEKYLNKAVSILLRRQGQGVANISISGERLVLTQSDMHPSNFGIDVTGRVVIFDFGEIGWLPESLANYTLLSTGEFISKVAAHVFGDHLDSSNLVSLGAVKAILGLAARATLGLDKDGNPVRARLSNVNS